MSVKLTGYQRKIHHTRYAKKALDKEKYLKKGQAVVVLTVDGEFPKRELGKIEKIEGDYIHVKLESGDYVDTFPGQIFVQHISNVDILLETEWVETSKRVASSISKAEKTKELKEKYYKEFENAISNFELVPAGRILTGAGDDSFVTLFNCYVTKIEPPGHQKHFGADSRQAIFHTMGQVSEIMARGGGNGLSLSVLRPKDSPLSKTKGRSSGAVHTGNMFSSLTNWVEQANRRGAQMLTLFDWHPDLFYTDDENHPAYTEDFIGAKQKRGFMTGNNNSVLITDKFMEAVKNDEDWELKFPDTTHPAYDLEWNGFIEDWEAKGYPVVVHRVVKARAIWDKIMKSNWASGEPGVIFIDRYNEYHNGRYLGKIDATNPCGEQGLLPYSTCNLSAINLGRMVKVVGEDELGEIYEIDWDKLKKTVRLGVRFLDNVIDVSKYFDEKMEKQQKGERRLGLGILGLHDMLIALRKVYGSDEGNKIVDKVMEFIKVTAYKQSIELAKEKGPFPLFDKKGIFQSKFIKKLPKDIQEEIKKHGLRNLTLLTVAPTGTTGTMTPSILDNEGSVSTGCEPHFAMSYKRKSRIGEMKQYAGVARAFMEKNPEKKLPEWYVGAMDLTPEQHVSVQAVCQKHVCSSISKTVNAPENYTIEQVKKVYELGYELGLKGVTLYRDKSRDKQILFLLDENTQENKEKKPKRNVINLADGEKDKKWTCPSCGGSEYVVQENCPKCLNPECGVQTCSI